MSENMVNAANRVFQKLETMSDEELISFVHSYNNIIPVIGLKKFIVTVIYNNQEFTSKVMEFSDKWQIQDLIDNCLYNKLPFKLETEEECISFNPVAFNNCIVKFKDV